MTHTEATNDVDKQSNQTSKDRMYDHLSTMFEYADKNASQIIDLRSKNMNYALLIFAGLVGISFKLKGQQEPQLVVAVACFTLMLLYNFLDSRYHKYLHQWRKRRRNFSTNKLRFIEGKDVITEQLDSEHEVVVSETIREQFTSPQRLIYHLLTIVALLSLVGMIVKYTLK